MREMTPTELDLRKKYNISTYYPYYGGWEYTSETQENDPFLDSLKAGITPQILSIMKATNAIIYPCTKISEARFSGSGLLTLMSDADTTPGTTDAMRGEIFIARYYKANGSELTETPHPIFVAAHELAHVMDFSLGEWECDRYGEGYLRPTSRYSSFLQDAYNADQATKPQATKLTEKFSLYRNGLLANEENKGRDNATEILCDLIAHELTGNAPNSFKRLKAAHPNIMQVALVLISACANEEGLALYKKIVKENGTFEDLKRTFLSPLPKTKTRPLRKGYT
jgi:hypothetical protein